MLMIFGCVISFSAHFWSRIYSYKYFLTRSTYRNLCFYQYYLWKQTLMDTKNDTCVTYVRTIFFLMYFVTISFLQAEQNIYKWNKLLMRQNMSSCIVMAIGKNIAHAIAINVYSDIKSSCETNYGNRISSLLKG